MRYRSLVSLSLDAVVKDLFDGRTPRERALGNSVEVRAMLDETGRNRVLARMILAGITLIGGYALCTFGAYFAQRHGVLSRLQYTSVQLLLGLLLPHSLFVFVRVTNRILYAELQRMGASVAAKDSPCEQGSATLSPSAAAICALVLFVIGYGGLMLATPLCLHVGLCSNGSRVILIGLLYVGYLPYAVASMKLWNVCATFR